MKMNRILRVAIVVNMLFATIACLRVHEPESLEDRHAEAAETMATTAYAKSVVEDERNEDTVPAVVDDATDLIPEMDSESTGCIVWASAEEIHILDDGYDELKAALETYNEETWNEICGNYEANLEWGTEVYPTRDLEIFDCHEIEVGRADSKVFSFLDRMTGYYGGAHGFAYEQGYIFDSQTGEMITLSDIVMDYDRLYELVITGLNANYDSSLFDIGYEELVYSMFYDKDNTSYPEWHMTLDGVRFIFNQYEIGPYSSDMFEVEIPYQGYEDLFLSKYMPERSDDTIQVTEKYRRLDEYEEMIEIIEEK